MRANTDAVRTLAKKRADDAKAMKAVDDL